MSEITGHLPEKNPKAIPAPLCFTDSFFPSHDFDFGNETGLHYVVDDIDYERYHTTVNNNLQNSQAKDLHGNLEKMFGYPSTKSNIDKLSPYSSTDSGICFMTETPLPPEFYLDSSTSSADTSPIEEIDKWRAELQKRNRGRIPTSSDLKLVLNDDCEQDPRGFAQRFDECIESWINKEIPMPTYPIYPRYLNTEKKHTEALVFESATRKREQNTISARRTRLRKTRRLQALELVVNRLTEINASLRGEIDRLHRERN